MQDGFIDIAGGTLNYASGQDIWIHGAVPTDGLSALARNGSTPTNSPTNFNGDSGSIDLSPEVPSAAAWAVMALIGAMLLTASGVLRRQQGAT
jgi:hypothetical protein